METYDALILANCLHQYRNEGGNTPDEATKAILDLIDQVERLQEWQARAFACHPNIDRDIELL